MVLADDPDLSDTRRSPAKTVEEANAKVLAAKDHAQVRANSTSLSVESLVMVPSSLIYSLVRTAATLKSPLMMKMISLVNFLVRTTAALKSPLMVRTPIKQ